MVYYRKYRPQTIQELDSTEAREKLANVLSSTSIPHAFLFTGPKGLGKTSSARIVAKIVNCEKRHLTINSSQLTKKSQKLNVKSELLAIEPCNKCDQCISITNGSNIDVLEIDGASNRGIDEIRDLREKIRLSPVSAAKKVYIIDEVHMLTTEAFNALLKTLEEPPAHAIFVLCTTEPHKVPATIASRCFHIAFSRATTDELVRSLSRIVKGEKLAISEDSLRLIANRADGSFRDAAKSLEELVLASSGGKITKAFVEEKLKTTNIDSLVASLLLALKEKDARKALAIVSDIEKQGTDMKFVIEELVNELHSMLLIHIGIESKEESVLFSLSEIQQLVSLFTKAYSELKYAVMPQLPLEMAVVEYIQAQNNAEPYAEKHAEVSDTSNVPAAFDGGVAARKVSLSSASFQKQGIGDNKELLTKLIDAVKEHSHPLAGVLRGCVIQKQENGELVLATNFTFHKERLEDEKAKEILQKAASYVLQRDITVSIVLKEKN